MYRNKKKSKKIEQYNSKRSTLSCISSIPSHTSNKTLVFENDSFEQLWFVTLLTLDVDFEIEGLVFQRLSNALVQARVGSTYGRVDWCFWIAAAVLGWCHRCHRCRASGHVLALCVFERNLDPGRSCAFTRDGVGRWHGWENQKLKRTTRDGGCCVKYVLLDSQWILFRASNWVCICCETLFRQTALQGLRQEWFTYGSKCSYCYNPLEFDRRTFQRREVGKRRGTE